MFINSANEFKGMEKETFILLVWAEFIKNASSLISLYVKEVVNQNQVVSVDMKRGQIFQVVDDTNRLELSKQLRYLSRIEDKQVTNKDALFEIDKNTKGIFCKLSVEP